MVQMMEGGSYRFLLKQLAFNRVCAKIFISIDLQTVTILALARQWEAKNVGSAKWWTQKQSPHLGISQCLDPFVWELGTKSKGLTLTLLDTGLSS